MQYVDSPRPAENGELTNMVTSNVQESFLRVVADDGIAASLVPRGGPGMPVDLALRITASLQTTLDVGRQITLFSGELRKAVAFDGVRYAHDELGVLVEEGAGSPHSCAYRLTVEGRDLGEIRFTRRSRFEDDEISLLEYLLCALVYPLRNALDYRHALDEARRDPLTGVYNRGALDAVMERDVALAHRNRIPLSVIFLDVDRFKSINDTYGHAVGDQVIRLFVERINAKVRGTDIVARYGGDEFVIVLSGTPAAGAQMVAERIREAVESTDTAAIAPGLMLTTSMGVATLGGHETARQFVERADEALKRAKELGRNRVCG